MTLVHGSAVPSGGEAKTVADILTAAADLIEPEGRWTQGAFGRDADGRARSVGSPEAVCFCGVGAIYMASGGQPYAATRAIDIVDSVARQKRATYETFADFNDGEGRTQAEVVAALRAAADKARTASAVGIAKGDEPKATTTEQGERG